MTLKEAQFIQNILTNAGEEIRIREDYSGRGMFGRETVAIETDMHPIQWIPIILSWAKESLLDGPWLGEIPDFSTFQMDNMGLGFIVY